MSSNLYPSRQRDVNVSLIKGVFFAESRQEQEAGIHRFRKQYHPSLFAEMDWMEMTIPMVQRENVANFVDDMLYTNLDLIVAQRRSDFDGEGIELEADVLENNDFYGYVLNEREDVRTVLGDHLCGKIEKILDVDEIVLTKRHKERYLEEFKHISSYFKDFKGDLESLATFISVELDNAVLRTLDHIPSRQRAKELLRRNDNQLPRLKLDWMNEPDPLDHLRGFLYDVGDEFRKQRLYRVFVLCDLLLNSTRDATPAEFTGFDGGWISGMGNCSHCSMLYSSRAMVFIDRNCPGVVEDDDGHISIPLRVNATECPFCETVQRSNTPAIFFSHKRHQAIYCVPANDTMSEQEALHLFRELFQKVRERYMRRQPRDIAEQFNSAEEIITYSYSDFLIAIQMGTVNPHRHCWLLIDSIMGHTFLCDTTTNVFIDVLPGEFIGDTVDFDYLESNTQERSVLIKVGKKAFDDGDYTLAKKCLEEAYKRNPEDQETAENLAIVYKALGDEDGFHRIAKGL